MFHFFYIIHIVWGHSWIHCLDYPLEASLQTVNNALCRAWPRAMKPVEFGLDQGMNYQPSDNRACRNTFEQAKVYSPNQKIRLLWPAKNHQADKCTNPYIPKGKLGIYAQKVTQWTEPDLSFSEWYADQYQIATLEFQNCPYFCSNMDKAACFGDLTLPQQPGKYKMNWIWMFNPGQFFTHCFDIEIRSTSQPPTPKFISQKPTIQRETSKPNSIVQHNQTYWKCHWCDCKVA